jgi:DNA-binding response OmpR family regulator
MTKEMKKILIIEDDRPLREAIKDKLVREGFSCIEAKNGKEGFEMALREHPDLILLDIVMPIMDGITMLKELRKDKWGKKAKIILLTNLSDNEKLAEVMQYEVFDYLVKSDWKIENIIKQIREQLNMNK